MSLQHRNALLLAALFSLVFLQPALAAQEVQITLSQAKAIAGNVTPGDTPGFPITLSQPGRYVLVSNLYPPPNTDGIVITSYDVTIDFQGFRLQGSGTARDGIVGFNVNTVAIQNGLVAFFKRNGIWGGASWVIDNMRVSANGGTGILLSNMGRVQKSTVTINGGLGITCNSCLVTENVISNNGSSGVLANTATVLGNMIVQNKSFGVIGSNGVVGIGNNTMASNNSGGAQVSGTTPLHANACVPAC